MATKATAGYSFLDGVAQFDLGAEIDQADTRRPWPSGVYSKTLLKERDLRLVLALMDSGTKMKEHHADGSVSIHVLRGSIRVRVQAGIHDLRSGQILTLLPSLRHEVEAMAPSAFLLTLSWPESDKLEAMPHRGYGS